LIGQVDIFAVTFPDLKIFKELLCHFWCFPSTFSAKGGRELLITCLLSPTTKLCHSHVGNVWLQV